MARSVRHTYGTPFQGEKFTKFSQVDAALELVWPLNSAPPSPAVAGGWAAIEALLTGPGDKERVLAGDRMAALVACSFPFPPPHSTIAARAGELVPQFPRFLECFAGSGTPGVAQSQQQSQQAGKKLEGMLNTDEIPFNKSEEGSYVAVH